MPRFSNEKRGIFVLNRLSLDAESFKQTFPAIFSIVKEASSSARLFPTLFLSTVRIDDDGDRPVVDELDIHHRAEYAGFNLEAVACQLLVEF